MYVFPQEPRGHQLQEQSFVIRTPMGDQLVFFGFDSSPPGPETLNRAVEFVESCGRQTLCHFPDRDSPSALAAIITLYGGNDLPETIERTVRNGHRTSSIRAKVLAMDSLTLDEILAGNLLMVLPFHTSRYAEKMPFLEKTPQNRETYLADIERIIRVLTDAEKGTFAAEARTLLIMVKSVLNYEVRGYPETEKAVNALFDGILTAEEINEAGRLAADQEER